MATYYVSTSGSNSNNGSNASPFATLQKAANVVSAGDTVIVQSGNYAGFQLTTSGTAAQRITFHAEEGVVINSPASRGDGINLEGASFVTVEGFTVQGATRAGIRSVENEGVIIRDNIAQNNGKWGIFSGFSENITVEGNIASGSAVEHGIYISNSADNPVIRNNTVFGNNASGIQLNADAEMGGDGIITNALIENNVIYENGEGGGAALNFDGVQDSLIRNNLLYDNHASGIALFQINGAEGSKNNDIYNNTIVMPSDGRWAINMRSGSSGNDIHHNILLTNHSYRGSIDADASSLIGLNSNNNIVSNKFTTDDADTILTLAQWRSQTGQDTTSLVKTISALFVNAGADDYHLLDSSLSAYGYQFSADGGANVIEGTPGNDNFHGTSGDDIMNGYEGNDQLDGEAGNDVIEGAEGTDNLRGGGGDDTIYGGEQTDTISGESGNDLIYAIAPGQENTNSGNDTMDGSGGNDTLHGSAGNESLNGGADNDLIYGYGGADTMQGGTGADTLYAANGNDIVFGGSGADSLFGGDGRDTLRGDAGNDYIDGGAQANVLYGDTTSPAAGDGNDTLMGGSSTDRIYGSGGNDRLVGKGGGDTLIGGDGEDVFVFLSLADSAGSSRDRIIDFDATEDSFDLSALSFNAFTTGKVTVAGEIRAAYSAASDRTYLRNDQNSFEFYLDGNHLAELDGGNFIF